MGDYIVFGSTMGLSSIIFYCLGIIVPTFTLLFNVGHLVFTVGEYKESDKTIPLIILLLSIKLFVVSFALFFVYHTIFDYSFHEISLTSITIFLWGLLIFCDTTVSNKLLGLLNKYTEQIPFRQYLTCGFKNIFKKIPYIFYGKILITSGLIICLILNAFLWVHETINILDCLLLIYLWISYKITKYFKTINKPV